MQSLPQGLVGSLGPGPANAAVRLRFRTVFEELGSVTVVAGYFNTDPASTVRRSVELGDRFVQCHCTGTHLYYYGVQETTHADQKKQL